VQVTEKGADFVKAKVTGPGLFKSRQGINLPNTILSTPSLTERDHTNLVWAANNAIDFVSLSFVRTPNDVVELKRLLKEHNAKALVIAKVMRRASKFEIYYLLHQEWI
jgi:pyruvate kinase